MSISNLSFVDEYLEDPRTFDELSGEVVQNVAFIVSNVKPYGSGCYYDLVKGKNSNEKMQLFKKSNETRCYYLSVYQLHFNNIPENTIAYWVSDKQFSIIEKYPKLGDVCEPRAGLQTSDNERFLRMWYEVNLFKIGFGLEREKALTSDFKWFPHNKGGETRKWYGNRIIIINFENDGKELKYWLEHNPNDPTTKSWSRNLRNYPLYFKEGITWGGMGNIINVRYSPVGSTFDTSGPMLFSDSNLFYILAFTNSCTFNQFIKIFSQGLSKGSGHFANIPYIDKQSEDIDKYVKMNISISKKDWDAHETSWDFEDNPLLHCIDVKIEEEGETADLGVASGSLKWQYEHYKAEWEQAFNQLHINEEELNRQFIEIYGLQDELTPDVPLDEITILQQGEISIEDNQIKWHADVVMKQLISYAIGCMMGRYRLDKKGLCIAHPNPDESEYAPYQYHGETFEIDEDGIIPLMPKDSRFDDNAVNRFTDFIKIVFGVDTLTDNMNFLEESLGKSVEQYLIKDFWKDHKKMYQNRPIYWLFSSKKGAFQVIAYMHRMNKYTAENIRNKYLLPHIDYLRQEIADLDSRITALTPQERKIYQKLQKDLEECMEYHDRLHMVADQQIAFDLDDGVVVNYAKFGDVLAKLK